MRKILIITLLAVMLGVSVWVQGGSFRSWVFAMDGGKPVVSQGPPLLCIARLNELVTVRVGMNESLEARNNWYEGTWLVAGDALLGTDCDKAETLAVEPERKTITLRLPDPRVISCRVNHELTRSLDLRSISWNPAQLFWGNREEIREEAMKQAQLKLVTCARSEDHILEARRQAESALGRLYSELGWKVTVVWRPARESNQ